MSNDTSILIIFLTVVLVPLGVGIWALIQVRKNSKARKKNLSPKEGVKIFGGISLIVIAHVLMEEIPFLIIAILPWLLADKLAKRIGLNSLSRTLFTIIVGTIALAAIIQGFFVLISIINS